jgi:inhibitor of cysteine peptidase
MPPIAYRTAVRRLLGLLVLPCLLLAACGDDDGGSSGGGTVYDQSGEQVATEVGEKFTIELAANPSTGYTWQLSQAMGDQVTLVDSDYEPEGDVQPGSSGVQRFVFEGLKVGTTTLSFSYVRPWETGVAPTETVAFPVSVS